VNRTRGIENQALHYIKTHTPGPKLLLETRAELHAFFAGVASCAHIVFGHPITERQARACILGEKEYMGGAFIVLESLNDDGVLRVAENKDGATTYELTSPVAISPALLESQYDAVINAPIRNVNDVRTEGPDD
jgi:hypothetical protein